MMTVPSYLTIVALTEDLSMLIEIMAQQIYHCMLLQYNIFFISSYLIIHLFIYVYIF